MTAGPVNISLVTVGDPGNLPDPATGYGAVPYAYQIGEYDVTMGQYAAFLNSVAVSGDPYGLYNTKPWARQLTNLVSRILRDLRPATATRSGQQPRKSR